MRMPTMQTLAFALQHIRYTPDHSLILDDISIDLSPGQWIGILGPNGAGKSTLLRIMAGVLPASTGVVYFAGKTLEQWPNRERAKQVGFPSAAHGFVFSVSRSRSRCPGPRSPS